MKDFRTALTGCGGRGGGFLLFDGATGTLLHSRGLPAGVAPEVWGLTRPDAVCDIHRSYIEAGADIIKSNTFGANSLNYPDGGGITVARLASAGLRNIRRASELAGREVYAAYDIGPCGRLIGSDITFDRACEVFAESVRAAVAAGGYDLILLETFGDLSEIRAALLAVKENCDLPAVVTCAYGKDGRSFTGTPASVMSAALEGLGADAVGMNCSFGPDSMLDILPSVLDSVNIPVCVNPNAGLPSAGRSGRAVYDCGPEEFSGTMKEIARRGAVLLGGCCGTTPEHIRALRSALSGIRPAVREKHARCRITSRSEIFVFGDGGDTGSGPGYAARCSAGVAVIGERINPTGKKRFREALLAGDGDYAVSEALSQASLGADILDVNVGIPGIDEPAVLCKTVEDIQRVCQLPLQIDTSSPAAMEAALRIYDGLPLINSVNGSEKSMSAILPLAAKYGGTVIALTLDGEGIPDSPEGRLEIARRIVCRAAEYGIGRERIIVDPLALTLGADSLAAEKTLAALRLIKSELGVLTSLGVSNISFGLPDRERVNYGFLRSAAAAGLDAAIMNPYCAPMMRFAKDPGSAAADEEAFAVTATGENRDQTSAQAGPGTLTLKEAVICGMPSAARAEAEKLCSVRDPQSVITDEVIPALDRVGSDFERSLIFLPGLLAAADAAIAALGVITDCMESRSGGQKRESAGKVVLATVEGDIHDIGKNIVGVMLRSYGYEVIDLGKNVPPERVCLAAEESGAKLVGLSALMTTTVPSMERTVRMLNERCPGVKTVVGGAVLTAEYAKMIGADRYSPDAMSTVRYAAEVYGSADVHGPENRQE